MLLMQQQELGGGVNNDFVFTVKSDNAGTSASNQFTIPTGGVSGSGGTWLYDVSTSDGYTATGLTGNHTITFPSGAGTHTVTISGQFSRMYFNNGGDRLKFLSVLNWGDVGWSTHQGASFYGCTQFTSIPIDQVWIFDNIGNCGQMFRNCRLTSLPNGITMNNVIQGSNGFRDNNLTSLPSTFRLNSLTNGFEMFRGNEITALPDGMTLSSLTNGWGMFQSNSTTYVPNTLTLNSLNQGIDMFNGCNISKSSYSQLLVNIESNNSVNTVTFHGGSSKYNATGQTARNILTSSPRNWTITDGGFEA